MPILLLLPLILGLGFLALMMLAARWFVNANPAMLARTIRHGGSLALVLVGLLLLLRGQVFLGASLVMAGLGKLGAGQGGFGGAGRASSRARGGRPSGGGASTVRSARLEATLDHDTGDMDAQVLAGRHEGRRFNEMTVGEVLEVWRDCADDEESRLIVEAYLDRRQPEWREDAERDGDGRARGAGGSGGGGVGTGAMTEQDAYEILGLQPGASEAEIRARHRSLMKQVHPDQGGSTFLAAKLNEAKDVLLRRR